MRQVIANLGIAILIGAAIKANDKNSQPELETIVEILHHDPNIKYCPHGRPVAMEMKKRNIDHQFERC